MNKLIAIKKHLILLLVVILVFTPFAVCSCVDSNDSNYNRQVDEWNKINAAFNNNGKAMLSIYNSISVEDNRDTLEKARKLNVVFNTMLIGIDFVEFEKVLPYEDSALFKVNLISGSTNGSAAATCLEMYCNTKSSSDFEKFSSYIIAANNDLKAARDNLDAIKELLQKNKN